MILKISISNNSIIQKLILTVNLINQELIFNDTKNTNFYF